MTDQSKHQSNMTGQDLNIKWQSLEYKKILSATDKEDNEDTTMIDAFKLTSNLIRMISKM
ncbi:37984_t:CDS:2, partial [Gigaspora margarita]